MKLRSKSMVFCNFLGTQVDQSDSFATNFFHFFTGRLSFVKASFFKLNSILFYYLFNWNKSLLLHILKSSLFHFYQFSRTENYSKLHYLWFFHNLKRVLITSPFGFFPRPNLVDEHEYQDWLTSEYRMQIRHKLMILNEGGSILK